LQNLGEILYNLLKPIWNSGLRPVFNTILSGIEQFINNVIDLLNQAWRLVGSPDIGINMPLPFIDIPPLPSLDVGGYIVKDIVAQLHAGEIVMPLDRIMPLLGKQQAVPAFSPTLNFYPGSSPSQIMPAIQGAYNWYIEDLRK